MSFTFIETVKIQLKTMNNGNICRMELANLEAESLFGVPRKNGSNLLVIDPAWIGHLLCLDAVGDIHSRLGIDDGPLDGILQINEGKGMILGGQWCTSSWLIGEVPWKKKDVRIRDCREDPTDLRYAKYCPHNPVPFEF